jgi:tetratricopeptide (TPR) repeat protein
MPLQEATTPSLEAWKAFSTASNAYSSSDAAAAVPLFKRAIAIDPNFASAHARLGIHYSKVGEWTLARESTLEAYRWRDRASDVERFWIDTLYDRQVTGNLERQQQTMESWARSYPRDPVPLGLLAGLATHSTGKYELSIAAADKALALDPDRAPTINSKAASQIALNRLADAEITLRQAADRHLVFANFLLRRYFIAFLKGDDEGVTRTAALARGNRALEDMMSHVEALALARPGRLREARRTSAVAYPIYVRGQTYLAAHEPAEAAAEFQRILDHRSIVLVDPMDAMARLQLARALALSGDAVKANERLQRSLFAVEERSPGHPGFRGRTGGIRATAVSGAFPCETRI